ncbi:MAG: hypothetical protein QXX46_04880 [Candidatus Anstonellales archaeon]
MVIGVKERKDKEVKFSDKIRRNFERFKDKVEGLGKKAIILGGVGIGVGLGCASDGIRTYNIGSRTYYILSTSEIEKMSIDELRAHIYKGATTRDDSITCLAMYMAARWGSIIGHIPFADEWGRIIPEPTLEELLIIMGDGAGNDQPPYYITILLGLYGRTSSDGRTELVPK